MVGEWGTAALSGIGLKWVKGHAKETDTAAGKALPWSAKANDQEDHFARKGAALDKHRNPNAEATQRYSETRAWYKWLGRGCLLSMIGHKRRLCSALSSELRRSRMMMAKRWILLGHWLGRRRRQLRGLLRSQWWRPGLLTRKRQDVSTCLGLITSLSKAKQHHTKLWAIANAGIRSAVSHVGEALRCVLNKSADIPS